VSPGSLDRRVSVSIVGGESVVVVAQERGAFTLLPQILGPAVKMPGPPHASAISNAPAANAVGGTDTNFAGIHRRSQSLALQSAPWTTEAVRPDAAFDRPNGTKSWNQVSTCLYSDHPPLNEDVSRENRTSFPYPNGIAAFSPALVGSATYAGYRFRPVVPTLQGLHPV
jgi:hypothetical protein